MLIEKMAKGHKQFLCMFNTTLEERVVNIVDYHGTDFFPAVRLPQEIVSQSRGRNCWNVLMLADSSDFIFAQSAKSDAIFHGNHDALLEHSNSLCSALLFHYELL